MDISEARHWIGHRRHPWELARARVIESLLFSSPSRHITSQSTVVDVGCGDAFLINRWSSRFPAARFLGIDTALAQDDVTQSQLPVKLFRSLDQAASTGDVTHVLLLDVLEHVPDERKLLHEISTSLSITAATNFIVTAPAFQNLFSSHDVSLGHYRRYSRRTICQVLSTSGMVIDECGCFFSSLLLPRLVTCSREKLFKSDSAARNSLLGGAGLGRVVGWMLERFLFADYRCGTLLRRCGFQMPGLSVFAVCRKPV